MTEIRRDDEEVLRVVQVWCQCFAIHGFIFRREGTHEYRDECVLSTLHGMSDVWQVQFDAVLLYIPKINTAQTQAVC